MMSSHILIALCLYDTATTEIHSSCHPLSMRHARPISFVPLSSGCTAAGETVKLGECVALDDARAIALAPRRTDPEVPQDRRSEEHTSELQSLMRISYAVSCLKQQIYYIPLLLPLTLLQQTHLS